MKKKGRMTTDDRREEKVRRRRRSERDAAGIQNRSLDSLIHRDEADRNHELGILSPKITTSLQIHCP